MVHAKDLACLTVILLFGIIIAQIHGVYLPERSDSRNGMLLESTYEKQQQQQQAQQNQRLPHEATAAALEQHIHHKSYDKIDDVAVVSADWLLAVGQEAAWPAATHDDTPIAEAESAAHTRQRRGLSDWLIAPNTRWCGRGNTANGTYNHLGGASAADKCCRKHDHCQVYIPAMSNRYELFNYRPYTLSHCHCDRRFRTCLKMAQDEDANTIGKLFFNMVQTQCFALKHEKVCQQRAEDGSCEREYVKQKAYLRGNKKF